jgi:DNA helicase II / ATP-dependent DNA helicase PcrA
MTTGTAAMDSDLLARLNDEQKEAVTLKWGPSLIIAGAGSGKTTVLTRRIAYLISELNQEPESILAVTFTNKAAGEMKNRIQKLLGFDVAKKAMIGTFHSICARLLRREIDNYASPEGWRWGNNFVIYDETDSLNVLKAQIKRLNLDDKTFAPRDIKHEISSKKNDGYTCSLYTKEARNYREHKIAEIFAAYQSDLARNNALDFDDLILIFTELLKTNEQVLNRWRRRVRHLLVDEFQDTNRSQYDLVTMLAAPVPPNSFAPDPVGEELEAAWTERSFMVVGDVDQSIYSWRKADFRIILGFQSDFKNAKLIKLEENYRSTSSILEVANSIIVNNTERIDKVLRCNRGKGSKAQCYEATDEIDEAFYVVEEMKRLLARGKKLAECVILYRTNAQSRAIEEVLVRSHVPYKMVGGTKFYDRLEIKDVIAYLKLVYNPRDGQAFNRVVNVPRRGIGKTSLEKVAAFAQEHNISMIDAASSIQQIGDISAKTSHALQDFANNVNRWQMFSKMMPVSQLLETILRETKYVERLQEDAAAEKDEAAEGRIENVLEFVNVAKEFESEADEPDLDSFLTRISLMSDLDSVKEDQDCVTLMTLHSAKGLEYSIVFLMGLEEGLFPHFRSIESGSVSQIEEERRLMYVGVTRAEDMLYITLARRRMLIGRGGGFSSGTIPSRFLKEITPGLLAGYYPAPDRDPQPGYSDSDDFADDYNGSGSGSAFGSRGGSGGSGSAGSGSGGRQGTGGYGSGNQQGTGGYGSGGRQGSGGYGSGNQQGTGSYGSGGGRQGSGGSSYGNGNPAARGSAPGGFGSSNSGAKPRAMRQDSTAGGANSGASKVARFQERQALHSNAGPQADRVEFDRLAIGDQVQHAKFGIGTVIKVIGEGDKELYNIEFQAGGNRLLDPRFAKLIKLT